jgi:type I restriction enzyme R subunit
MTSLWPLQVFDPKQEFFIVERKLPHWSQAGTVCFITWRTADSIPQSVLNRWHGDRESWLRKNGIEPGNSDWKSRLRELSPELRSEFVRTFSRRWHRYLDSGMGDCVLRQSELSLIVADALKKFDGDRYELTDFVVMPNHVHLIAAFRDEAGMLSQCEAWKHYTARTINRELGKSGTFWQQDGFDHLIRSDDYFQAFRRYIAENGTKAGLQAGEFRHYSKLLGGENRK